MKTKNRPLILACISLLLILTLIPFTRSGVKIAIGNLQIEFNNKMLVKIPNSAPGAKPTIETNFTGSLLVEAIPVK